MLSTNTTVDVIVNNAGVNDDKKLENKAFDIMNTNLFGIINLTETILPQLTQDGKVIHSFYSRSFYIPQCLEN